MGNNIGIQNVDTGVGSAGVGFVIIPDDQDRKDYIRDCYRTNTLTINGGLGYGLFPNVKTDINVMKKIIFPINYDERGSAVVWIRDSISQLPVVIALLRKQEDYYQMDEQQNRERYGTNEKNVEIFLDGNSATYQINIIGDDINPANLNIKLSSKNKDSVFNLSCDNELNIKSDNTVNVESSGEVNVSISKNGETLSFLKMNEDKINIVSNKIIHSSGKEDMVLGNTLANLLKDILSAIEKITVATPLGTSGTPINSASFLSISDRVDDILSKISKIE